MPGEINCSDEDDADDAHNKDDNEYEKGCSDDLKVRIKDYDDHGDEEEADDALCCNEFNPTH